MIRKLKPEELTQILRNNYIGNLSYIYENTPYVVPITYFYDEKNNHIISYSGKGHKINAMRKNNRVSLGVSEIKSVSRWKSILVQGKFVELSRSNAKAILHDFSLGVKNLIEEKEGRSLNFISEFSSKIYNEEIPIVYIITIDGITGKLRNK